MLQLGDFADNATVDFKFNTSRVDGTPISLVGGTLAVYKDDSAVETTTGITLSANQDGRTGMHHVRILTTDAFYTPGSNFHVVLTGGTVDGVSVNGAIVAQFSMVARLQSGDAYAVVSSGVHGNAALLSALQVIDDFLDTEIGAILTNTNRIPASPAAVGDVPTANQNADALLDRASAIDTKTLRQAMRYIAAAVAGRVSGMGTNTPTFLGLDEATARLSAVTDGSGNRTDITYDP